MATPLRLEAGPGPALGPGFLRGGGCTSHSTRMLFTTCQMQIGLLNLSVFFFCVVPEIICLGDHC